MDEKWTNAITPPLRFEYDNYGNGGYSEWYEIIDADGYAIARVYSKQRGDFQNYEALAHLFTATPALVEAVKKMLSNTYSGDDVRLLAVGLGGTISDEIHERCDRINASIDEMIAALALSRGESDD
jgi:hypothetical protein